MPAAASPAPSPPSCLIGAHARVAGGLARGGIRHVTQTAAEAVQVFVSNPQGWALPRGDRGQDMAFREHMEAARVPIFVHAPYLVNFGSPTEQTVRLSGEALAHALRRGHEIGARGVVVHTGSAVTGDSRTGALRQVREKLLPILDAVPKDGPEVLLEPTAGQGQSLCAIIQDLGPYLAALDRHPRLGVCLDTCHLFAAGHDLAAAGGVHEALAQFDETAGRSRLRLVHANDSVDVCGSRRDRHHNIGDGHLGEKPFAELLHHPVVRGVPFLVETPGKEGAHSRDVEKLKRLRDDQTSLTGEDHSVNAE